MDSMATHHKTKLDRIDHYLRFHNVAPELRLRIVQFYKYLFVASQSSDDLSLFRDLPTQMSLHLSVAITARSSPSARSSPRSRTGPSCS